MRGFKRQIAFASLASLLVGFAAGYLLWAESSLEHLRVYECLGDPIVVEPAPGFRAHGLTLLLVSQSQYSPLKVTLSGWSEESTVLEASPTSETLSYAYSGRWSGPATLSVSAPKPACVLDVYFEFDAVPSLP